MMAAPLLEARKTSEGEWEREGEASFEESA